MNGLIDELMLHRLIIDVATTIFLVLVWPTRCNDAHLFVIRCVPANETPQAPLDFSISIVFFFLLEAIGWGVRVSNYFWIGPGHLMSEYYYVGICLDEQLV